MSHGSVTEMMPPVGVNVSARSAPILLRWSSFLRGSIAEIQGYGSAQKRAPTDRWIPSYDAINLMPKFTFSQKDAFFTRLRRLEREQLTLIFLPQR